MRTSSIFCVAIGASLLFVSCNNDSKPVAIQETKAESELLHDSITQYIPVVLTTDTSKLSAEEKQVLKLLIRAAAVMDKIFWKEAYGNPDSMLTALKDSAAREFFSINYGPWDRLDGNNPCLKGVGPKPAGANFYPSDITEEEFKNWTHPMRDNPYSVVSRGETGNLMATRYSEAFRDEVAEAAGLLREAASITTDAELKFYLELRASALETDIYGASDVAWLGMKNNHLDIIIGPIENYEDQFAGIRTAHEAYVLVKDMEWSKRLERYTALLPDLQTKLPVDAAYRKDKVGSQSQLAAYDVVYYAGDCNSGSKTIAVNLPNDEKIQQEHGTRRSQLKNAMKAKYDNILSPIADELIVPEQRQNITFNAFFGNVMFHEVAHGLGVKNTITDGSSVSKALAEQHSALEEAKADVLGLWLVTRLFEMGELTEGRIEDHYVTFVAGIFRSCRFGASSAHGKANMMTFNFLQERNAFTRNEQGKYQVNHAEMIKAIDELAGRILKLQGDGAYQEVKNIMATEAQIGDILRGDINRINQLGIPTDVVFRQGEKVLGL
ncbi:MAG: hypothetical protein RL220_1461 [Bacteroidota bacterium]